MVIKEGKKMTFGAGANMMTASYLFCRFDSNLATRRRSRSTVFGSKMSESKIWWEVVAPTLYL